MKTTKMILSALLCVMLLAALTIPAGAADIVGPKDGVGMNLSGMHTTSFQNEQVDGSLFQTHTITVLNIWATWCGPCLGEMPDFRTLNEYYGSTPAADVQIVGVLYDDYGDNFPEAVQIVEENGYDWLQIKMCSEIYAVADSLGEYIGIPVPQTMIVDSTGTVRAHKQGRFWDYDDLYTYVNGWYETVLAGSGPSVLIGDVNGNGSIDSQDALSVLRHVLGTALLEGAALSAADMNGDGHIAADDALTILRAALNIGA
ncbi:MAG: redoxin family protein [Clostridia bacterium]|nr:redoxin family protein [Clostridia bacterium]